MNNAHFTLFVKQECQTCALLVPVFERLRQALPHLAIFVEDDPSFLSSIGAAYDKTLEHSFRAGVEITPTLVRSARQQAGAPADAAVAPAGDRSRPCLRPGSGRVARSHRNSRPGLRSAGLQSGLRIADAPAGSMGTPAGAVRRLAIAKPPHRGRRVGRPNRGLL